MGAWGEEIIKEKKSKNRYFYRFAGVAGVGGRGPGGGAGGCGCGGGGGGGGGTERLLSEINIQAALIGHKQEINRHGQGTIKAEKDPISRSSPSYKATPTPPHYHRYPPH